MADELGKEVEVLTRDFGIKTSTLPTGRTIGVLPIKGTSTYKISYTDGKPGDLPQEFSGVYTGRQRAELDAKKYVTRFWDLSDKSSGSKKQSAVAR